MDGTIGGAGRIPQESLRSPYIDIFTNHYYGGPATPARDATIVASYNKAFIVGEYGLTNNTWYDQFAEATINTPEVTGCLIWSLRYFFHTNQLDITASRVGFTNIQKVMDFCRTMHQDFLLPMDFMPRSNS